MFGTGNAPTFGTGTGGAAAPFTFGQKSAATASGTTGSSLFGLQAAPNTTTTPSGLFSGAVAASTPSISFVGNTLPSSAAPAATSEPKSTQGGLFGGLSTGMTAQTTTADSATSATPLFPAATTAANFGASTTPAAKAISSLSNTPGAAGTLFTGTATPIAGNKSLAAGTSANSAMKTLGSSWTTSSFGGKSQLLAKGSGGEKGEMSEEEIRAGLASNDQNLFFECLQEVVKKYLHEISAQERSFHHKIMELNAYDRELVASEPKIIGLFKDLENLGESSKRLSFNVGSMTAVLNDVEKSVLDLEKQLNLPDWTTLDYKFPVDKRFASKHDVQRVQIAQMMLNVDSQIKSADYDLDNILEQLKSLQASTVKTKNGAPLEKTELILKKHLQNLSDLASNNHEITEKLKTLKEAHSLRLNNSRC